MTRLVTLSDISAAGIGAAFWGVVAGSVTLAVQNLAPPRSVFGAPPGGAASSPAEPVLRLQP